MSRLKTDAIRNVNASVDGITLDTSGNVAIPNELQLADKIVHTGDTNTFIRFPAADVIAFETGGTERLRINSDGRIWVNTQTGSSGTELLRVENTGSSSTNSRVSIVSGGAAQAVLLFGDDQSFDQGQIVYSNSDHSMRFHANAGNERLRVHSNGNVTIGSASFDTGNFGSVQGLNVYGTQPLILVNATGNGTSFFMGKTSNACYFGTSDAQNINFRVSDADKMILDSSGRLLLGTTTEGNASADDLTVATSGTTGITIRSGDTNTGNIYFSDATSGTGEFAGAIEYAHNGNSLRLHTNSDERFRIASNGKVSIAPAPYSGGGTVPELYIRGGSGRSVKIHNPNAGTSSIQLTNQTTGEGEDVGFFIQQLSGGDAYFTHIVAGKDIVFRTQPSGGSVTERVRIPSTGGITFNGDTAAANALNDYEEGTFSFNESTISVSNYGMKYVKIGKMVYLTGRIVLGNTSDTGILNMTGIPFTPNTDVNNSAQHGYVGETNLTNSLTPVHLALETSSSTVRIRTDNYTALQRNQVAGYYFRFSMWYLAAS